LNILYLKILSYIYLNYCNYRIEFNIVLIYEFIFKINFFINFKMEDDQLKQEREEEEKKRQKMSKIAMLKCKNI